jgi:predicted RNase H-like HicB family nuclease
LRQGGAFRVAEYFQTNAFVSLLYSIVLHKSKEGYAVSCPTLPGCWSQGATEEAALENIRDAIREYLAAINETL